jgi:hypothetical protein
MRGGGLLGLLVVAVIVGLAYKYYFAGTDPQTAAIVSKPRQAIDAVGVKNDLIAIAQAERSYQVQNSKYGSLDDLVSSGTLSMPKSGRDGYTYEVTSTDDNFHVIAHCPTATIPGCSNFTVDSTLQVTTMP